MRKNKNLIKKILIGYFGYVDEFLIPKTIGTITKFLHTTYSVLKTLPPGHRYRGDVEFL